MQTPQPTAREFNFDGLVGPTHHYAGLSLGNIASCNNANSVANPKQAALQGLEKMYALMQRGFGQGVLPPQNRPNFTLLRNLGFGGSDADVLARAYKESPLILACAYSASAMWAANAATVSPSADTADGRLHFTPANLHSKLHRSQEHLQTTRTLRRLFNDPQHFAVHEALPSTPAFSDEGAANHTRLCDTHGSAGIALFVYGRSEFGPHNPTPTHYPARHTLEASQAVARQHGLNETRTVYFQQNPDVIDQGIFHNDVIAVGNCNVLFYHQQAFLNETASLASLQSAMENNGIPLHAIRVGTNEISIEDAVSSYLFNSQLLSKPNGKMALVIPQECQENKTIAAYLQKLLHSGSEGSSRMPIDELLCFDLRQSMRNGGGPACLRLRTVLTRAQERAMHQGVIMDDHLYKKCVAWVEKHYRDRLSPADLADPALAIEVQTALDELAQILNLPGLYDL